MEPCAVAGDASGYFSGSIHDVRVWNEAFLWQAGSSPDMHPQHEAVALSIRENAAAGSVVTSLRGISEAAGQNFAAVWAAKRDPQFVDVARRHLRYPAWMRP